MDGGNHQSVKVSLSNGCSSSNGRVVSVLVVLILFFGHCSTFSLSRLIHLLLEHNGNANKRKTSMLHLV